MQPTYQGRAYISVNRTEEAVAAKRHTMKVLPRQHLERWNKRQMRVAKQQKRGAGQQCAVVNGKWYASVVDREAAAATNQ